MKKYVQMVLVLFTISVICGLVMGGVNKWTAPIIARNQEKKALAQIKEIFNEVDKREDITEEVELEEGITQVYKIFDKNNNLVGYIVELTGTGYSGGMKLIIGVEPDGKIRGVRSPQNNETPGIGQDLLKDKKYLSQFENLADPSTIATNEGINAGATRTTSGIVAALRKARNFVLSIQGLTDPVLEAAYAIFGFENYSDITSKFENFENDNRKALYTVSNTNGNVLGYMFRIHAPEPFSSPLETYIGIDLDGYIVGIAYGEFGETQGWGAKVQEEAFINEIVGRSSIDQIDVKKIDEILGVVYEEGKDGEAGSTIDGPGITKLAMLNALEIVFDYFAENLNDQAETILGLFENADSYSKLYLRNHKYILNVYEVYDSEENVLGYVYKTNAVESFNGTLEIFFALNPDGEVVEITYGAFNETPGYGEKAKEEEFITKFIGIKSIDELDRKALNDFMGVDTDSGATRTLDGIVGALEEVFEVFKKNHVNALKAIYTDSVVYKRDRSFIADSVLKELYIILDGEDEVGYAFRVEAPEAFAGIEMFVGLDAEGKVKDLYFTVMDETPADRGDYGGALLENEEFLNQFTGKDKSEDIDGIDAETEATRTLKSVKNGVKHVLDYYKESLSK